MSWLVALLVCAAASGVQDAGATGGPSGTGGSGRDRAMELLAERRFGPALAAAAAEPDARLRAGAECEIAYAGRDFEGALAAAERGLALAPADPRLLQLACASALWLQDAGLAEELSRRFEQGAAAQAPDSFGAQGALGAWTALARDYAERAAQLALREAERDAARARARGVSAAVLGLVLLAALGLARGARGAAALSAGS